MRRIAWIFLVATSIGSTATLDDPMTIEDILLLSKAGRPAEEILSIAKGRRLAFRLDDQERRRLQDNGVGTDVIRGLREIQLVDDVLSYCRKGRKHREIVRFISAQGILPLLSGTEILALRKSGVPDLVLDALRGEVRFPGYVIAEDPGGRYRLQHPSGWRKLEEFDGESTKVAWTPDPRAAGIGSAETAFRIEMRLLGRGTLRHRPPLARLLGVRSHERRLAAKEKGEDFRPVGEIRAGRIRGLPTVMAGFETSRDGRRRRGRMALFLYQDTEYRIVWEAPGDAFTASKATFEDMEASFAPTPRAMGERVRKPAADPKRLVERYRESVVRVRVKCLKDGANVHPGSAGLGTGWFVRSDGYLLTNHHVVYCKKCKKLRTGFELIWDALLKRAPVKAELIDAVKIDSPMVDIALLKARGTGYRPIPMTPTEPPNRFVKEADQVLAVGFPGITDQRGGNRPLTVTATVGHLVRFRLTADGGIDHILHTAQIHGGNSGGPCFDLETHSVIGLNTTSLRDTDSKDSNIFVASEYNGIVPTDAVFRHFPEIFAYPQSAGAKLRPEDRVSLALQFARRGLHRAAERQLKEVWRTGSRLPEAYACAGDLRAAQGDQARAMEFYDRALGLDARNLRALRGIARLVPGRALDCSTRLISLRPRDYRAYLRRARIHQKEGRPAEALRDARRAAEHSSDLYAEPFTLLGELLYAQGMVEEGRVQFQKACAVDPENFVARLGLIDARVRGGEVDSALIEVERLGAKYQGDSRWAKACGDFYWGLAKRFETRDSKRADVGYQRAYEAYGRLLTLTAKTKADLEPEAILRRAWLAQERVRDAEAALSAYARLTHLRGTVSEAALAYYNVATIYQEKGRKGLAAAFFRLAAAEGEGTPIAELARGQLQGRAIRLSQDDLFLLCSGPFHEHTAARLILRSPLAFVVSNDLLKGLAKEGISRIVLNALMQAGRASRGQDRLTGATLPDTEVLIAKWRRLDSSLLAEAKRILLKDIKTIEEGHNKEFYAKRYDKSIPGHKRVFYRILESGKKEGQVGVSLIFSTFYISAAYAAQGRKEEALEWLQFCVDVGLLSLKKPSVLIDASEFDSIRHEPRFARLVKGEAGRGKLSGGDDLIRVRLGAELRTLTEKERRAAGLEGETIGLLVAKVYPGGPADLAGIVKGDVLLRIADKGVVTTLAEIKAVLKTMRPGGRALFTKVVLFFRRDGLNNSTYISLGGKDGDGKMVIPPQYLGD